MHVLSHKFTSRRIHARPCVHVHPCASFRMSSLLVASIHILASVRVLSCSARLRFGAVTCVSHVLWCAHACAQHRLPSSSSAGLRSCPCTARGTPRMRSGIPRASCSSVSADRRIGRSGPSSAAPPHMQHKFDRMTSVLPRASAIAQFVRILDATRIELVRKEVHGREKH